MKIDLIGSTAFVRFLESADSRGRIERFPFIDASGRSLVATKVAIDDDGRFFNVLSDVDEGVYPVFTKWLSFTADTVADAHVSLYDAEAREIYELSSVMIVNLGIDRKDAKGSSLQDVRDRIRIEVLRYLDEAISEDRSIEEGLIAYATKSPPGEEIMLSPYTLEHALQTSKRNDDPWSGTPLESFVPDGGIRLVIDHMRDPSKTVEAAARNLLENAKDIVAESMFKRNLICESMPAYLKRRETVLSKAKIIRETLANPNIEKDAPLRVYAAKDGRGAVFVASKGDLESVLGDAIEHDIGRARDLRYSKLSTGNEAGDRLSPHDVRGVPGSLPSIYDVVAIECDGMAVYEEDRGEVESRLACAGAETAVFRPNARARECLIDRTKSEVFGIETLDRACDLSGLGRAEGRVVVHRTIEVGRSVDVRELGRQALEEIGIPLEVGDVIIVGHDAFVVDREGNDMLHVPDHVDLDAVIEAVKRIPCEGPRIRDQRPYDLEIKALEARLSCGMEKADAASPGLNLDQARKKS